MSVHSMTGYASLRVPFDATSIAVISIKGVNHRFLDLSVRAPASSEALEMELRRLVKTAVARGHVEVTVYLEGQANSSLSLNEELLADYVAAFRAVAKRLGLASEPDLNQVVRLPGMMVVQQRMTQEAMAAYDTAVCDAMSALLVEFNRSRAAEGATLAAALTAGMARLQLLADEVSKLRTGACSSAVERFRSRLIDLTSGVEGQTLLSEERLLGEAALLADRGDVEEELVRLKTHAARFSVLLEQGGEVGKRLDFLVQEMGREANTLLSKSGGMATGSGLQITELGLEMKVEIERAKEQVQNLE